MNIAHVLSDPFWHYPTQNVFSRWIEDVLVRGHQSYYCQLSLFDPLVFVLFPFRWRHHLFILLCNAACCISLRWIRGQDWASPTSASNICETHLDIWCERCAANVFIFTPWSVCSFHLEEFIISWTIKSSGWEQQQRMQTNTTHISDPFYCTRSFIYHTKTHPICRPEWNSLRLLSLCNHSTSHISIKRPTISHWFEMRLSKSIHLCNSPCLSLSAFNCPSPISNIALSLLIHKGLPETVS